MLSVHIEKFVFGGQGLGHIDGRAAFVWNALPGEIVEMRMIRNKKDFVEGIATDILEKSLDRVEPKEPHFLATSAWDILAWEKELEWKRVIARETYAKIGNFVFPEHALEIATDGRMYGYRNKMEFSFTIGLQQSDYGLLKFESKSLKTGEIQLAFFERGGRSKVSVDGSVLAESLINETAQKVLAWVNEQEIPIRSLKSLIVRSGEGRSVAALFLKDELTFSSYPVLDKTFLGFHMYYSTHRSPASVPSKLLLTMGEDTMGETIREARLLYGPLSFFQINVPMFEIALGDMAEWIHPSMPLVDFYAGVGSISIPLSHDRDETVLVENHKEAGMFAEKNIEMNSIKHARVLCVPAESMLDAIRADMIIVLDPPRAGLHTRIIERLLRVRPPRVLYLSCNIATQARDLRLLSEVYRPAFMKLYNFFPRTPHIEGLVVLDMIS